MSEFKIPEAQSGTVDTAMSNIDQQKGSRSMSVINVEDVVSSGTACCFILFGSLLLQVFLFFFNSFLFVYLVAIDPRMFSKHYTSEYLVC